MTIAAFYDQLCSFYHVIYPDWEASIAKQAEDLDSVIRQVWGQQVSTVLDVACGIGTQAIGLAACGYQVTASDLSPKSIARARREAEQRQVHIDFSVADMRQPGSDHDLDDIFATLRALSQSFSRVILNGCPRRHRL
jgi:2-polyprenyl-3-methyl-5-hydroxy-6-metoxy-1,4-benzoquinol methylase